MNLDNRADALLGEIVSPLESWWFDYSHQRNGRNSIPVSTWFLKLLDVRRQLERIANHQVSGRPKVAIWGPRQSGKSITLGRMLDFESNRDGDATLSALEFPGGDRFRFAQSVENKHENVFNPFRGEKDATACPCEFYGVAEEHLDDAKHPVECFLITNESLLHTLAVAYSSETAAIAETASAPQNAQVTADQIRAELTKITSASDGQHDPAQLEAVERLIDLVRVVDLMTSVYEHRFIALAPKWRAELRTVVLDEPRLLSDAARIQKLTTMICWDDDEEITALYTRLYRELTSLRSTIRGRPIRASLAAAKRAVGFNDEQPVQLSLIDRGKFLEAVETGNGANGTVAATFSQALIQKLRIPANLTTLQNNPQHADAFRLLEGADVIDLPGTAVPENATSRKVVDIRKVGESQAFEAQFIRAGKTLSAFQQYVTEEHLSAVILVRKSIMENVPMRPIGERLDRYFNIPAVAVSPTDSPVFVMLTFFETVVSHIRGNPNNGSVLDGFRKVLSDLDGIARTNQLFVTSCPPQPGSKASGSPDIEDADSIAEIERTVFSSPDVIRLFQGEQAKNSIRASIRGEHRKALSIVLDSVRMNLNNSRPFTEAQYYDRAMSALQNEILQFFDLDPDIYKATARSKIKQLIDFIDRIGADQPAAGMRLRRGGRRGEAAQTEAKKKCIRAAREICRIFSIPPESLDSPKLVLANFDEAVDYVENQRRHLFTQPAPRNASDDGFESGLGFATLAELHDFIRIIWDGSIDALDEAAGFILDNLGRLDGHDEAEAARSFIATAIENALLFGQTLISQGAGSATTVVNDPQAEADIVHRCLTGASGGATPATVKEALEGLPEYVRIVKPFRARLESLLQSEFAPPDTAPGDEKVGEIKARLQTLISTFA